MKKLTVFALACITMVIMLYLVKTLPRDSDETINDKPVGSMFEMMDDVYETHHSKDEP